MDKTWGITMESYLVMLQTNSNQPFIFSSPRLREQIGASFEITLLSKWVKDKAEELLNTKTLPSSFWVSDSSGKVIVRFAETDGVPKELAKRLIREVTLRALTDAPGLDVTGVFIETSSGPVDPADLKRLDREFSEYSLNRRPALARFPQFPFLERADESALPAVTPLTNPDTKRIYETARAVGVKESYEGRAKLKEQKKQENAEGSQSTVLIDFNSFLYTATKEDAKPEYKLSLPARSKRAWALPARFKQLDDVSGHLKTSMADLYRDPTRLEAAFQETEVVEQEIVQEGEAPEDRQPIQETTPPLLSSVGVVHVDGNGVGAIMRNLGKSYDTVQSQLDSLRSAAYKCKNNPCERDKDPFQWFIMEVNYRLDGVVKAAVSAAWRDVEDYARGRQAPPVVPVLVGGDDLTVYVEGKFAIPFAESYVRHYEQLTGEDELLKQLAVVAGAKKPGPLTASAGVAIVSRNFPFHIAYDLAEELVKRGKKLGKKPGTVPCSTINFHVLRDATVLDPEDTLNEHKGRTQRPFLIGHYAPQRIGDATTTSSEETPTAKPQPLSSWARILQAVAAFDGKKPDDPTQTTGDPFPRARANRIVKLLAEGKEDQAATEWGDALQNAPSAGLLAKQLKLLSPHSSSSDEAGESLEQIKWLLDLIDLSGNLPDGYLASRISGDADIFGSAEAADDSTEGGAQ